MNEKDKAMLVGAVRAIAAGQSPVRPFDIVRVGEVCRAAEEAGYIRTFHGSDPDWGSYKVTEAGRALLAEDPMSDETSERKPTAGDVSWEEAWRGRVRGYVRWVLEQRAAGRGITPVPEEHVEGEAGYYRGLPVVVQFDMVVEVAREGRPVPGSELKELDTRLTALEEREKLALKVLEDRVRLARGYIQAAKAAAEGARKKQGTTVRRSEVERFESEELKNRSLADGAEAVLRMLCGSEAAEGL